MSFELVSGLQAQTLGFELSAWPLGLASQASKKGFLLKMWLWKVSGGSVSQPRPPLESLLVSVRLALSKQASRKKLEREPQDTQKPFKTDLQGRSGGMGRSS